MVFQSECCKNCCYGNGKCHSFFSSTSARNVSWDDSLPVPTCVLPWSTWIVFFASVFCFYNSLNGEFVFDDSEAVINNLDLKPESPIINIFENDFWGTKLTHNSSHKSYRPLTVLAFRINLHVMGLQPYSFHFVNILLHGTVSVLVFKVLSIVFIKTVENESPKAAFLSALLFSVHPIHTESVAAVVGQADLLCGIFFIFSFLSYIRATDVENKNTTFLWLWSCVLFASMAMLCKEHGITVLGICCIYDMIVIYKFDFQDVYYVLQRKQEVQWFLTSFLKADFGTCGLYARDNMQEIRNNLCSFFMRQSVLIFGGCSLLALRWYIMGSSTPVFQQVDNPASFEESIFVRIINYHYIYALNAWLLFHPYWLCFDWSMGCIPLIHSVKDGRILVVIIFWLFFGQLLYTCITLQDKKIRRLLCLSVSFLLVPFLPASNLFFRVGFVVAERILYLPSMGFCLLVVIGLKQLGIYFGQNHQIIFQWCILILLIVFGIRCVKRSADWSNEENLFQSGLNVCPLNAKVHYNIAKNAADNGNHEVAIKRYKEAIRLNPHYDQAMNNLANVLKDQGKLLEAEKLLLSAIKIRPDFAAAWMNLGIVQSSLKKMNSAEKSYLTAIHYRKRYPDCFYNLGNLYLEQGRYDDAYRAWRNATSLQLSHLVAWNNMVIMLDSIGDLEKAEAVGREALRHLPFEASVHFNLANTLGKAGKYVESEEHFLKAIELHKNNPTYHANLGVLYHRWKKYQLAEECYKRALEIKPDMKSSRQNLRLLQKTLSRF